MQIHEMGDGLLVQLERKDIIALHYSIIELKLSNEPTKSHTKTWLLPFLQYLLAESGENIND